ncbi:MAG: hypothetical protein ACKO01_11640 [Erythrobacter sp.]
MAVALRANAAVAGDDARRLQSLPLHQRCSREEEIMALSILAAVKALNAFRQGADAVRHIGAPTVPRQGAQVFALPTSVGELPHGDADAIARPPAAGNHPQPPTPVETLYDHPRLNGWLRHDHRQAGYQAGLASPDHESLDHEIKILQFRFGNLLLQLEADVNARIGQAERRVSELGPVSPIASTRIKATIARLGADLAEIARQRQVGRSDETGWLGEAKASFIAGFNRALKESAETTKFLR